MLKMNKGLSVPGTGKRLGEENMITQESNINFSLWGEFEDIINELVQDSYEKIKISGGMV